MMVPVPVLPAASLEAMSIVRPRTSWPNSVVAVVLPRALKPALVTTAAATATLVLVLGSAARPAQLPLGAVATTATTTAVLHPAAVTVEDLVAPRLGLATANNARTMAATITTVAAAPTITVHLRRPRLQQVALLPGTKLPAPVVLRLATAVMLATVVLLAWVRRPVSRLLPALLASVHLPASPVA